MDGGGDRSHLRAEDLAGGTLKVSGITFQNGRYAQGASIYASNGSLLVTKCTFSSNHPSSQHTVFCEYGDEIVVLDCDFVGNGVICGSCSLHPGIGAHFVSSARIERCNFDSNSDRRASCDGSAALH